MGVELLTPVPANDPPFTHRIQGIGTANDGRGGDSAGLGIGLLVRLTHITGR